MDKSQDAVSLYDVVTYAGYKWFVIKMDQDKVTLLAKNDDFGRLRFDRESSDYQNSEIRHYLNTAVLNRLTENGAEILETNIPEFGVKDKVWLLSEDEAKKLPKEIKKLTHDWWWLRSSGSRSSDAAYVRNDGSVNTFGRFVNNESGHVRPAITVKADDLLKSNDSNNKKNDEGSILDKALKLAEAIADEINHDPFLQSEPVFSKEVECCIEHWMYRDDEESAIEDDWIARQSRILDIFQSHGLLFKAIYPGFKRLAGYDTMTELVSSYLVFSHKVGSGVITAKVDKDRRISGGVTIIR